MVTGINTITCTTPATDMTIENITYPGGRGVHRQLYTREVNTNSDAFPDHSVREPYSEDVLSTFESETNRGTNYEQRLRAIFMPRKTGLQRNPIWYKEY